MHLLTPLLALSRLALVSASPTPNTETGSTLTTRYYQNPTIHLAHCWYSSDNGKTYTQYKSVAEIQLFVEGNSSLMSNVNGKPDRTELLNGYAAHSSWVTTQLPNRSMRVIWKDMKGFYTYKIREETQEGAFVGSITVYEAGAPAGDELKDCYKAYKDVEIPQGTKSKRCWSNYVCYY